MEGGREVRGDREGAVEGAVSCLFVCGVCLPREGLAALPECEEREGEGGRDGGAGGERRSSLLLLAPPPGCVLSSIYSCFPLVFLLIPLVYIASSLICSIKSQFVLRVIGSCCSLSSLALALVKSLSFIYFTLFI